MISQNFKKFVELFPEDVVRENERIYQLQYEINKSLEKDFIEIKNKISQNRISIKFDFSKSEDFEYLMEKSLYKRENVPIANIQKTAFFLSNISECRLVIKYLLSELIANLDVIKNQLNYYLTKKSNMMFRLFNNFTGYCININQAIRDYNSFIISLNREIVNSKDSKTKLNDKNIEEISSGNTPVFWENRPSSNDMAQNIVNSLLSHNALNDRSYNYALIRPYLEFLLNDELRLKLQYLLKKYVIIDKHEIRFTKRTKFEDYITILESMQLLNEKSLTVTKKIHDWGSRSIHQTQMVPIHKIWISLIYFRNFLIEEINKRFNNVNISKEKVEEIYGMLKDKKIILIDKRFITSLYDLYPF